MCGSFYVRSNALLRRRLPTVDLTFETGTCASRTRVHTEHIDPTVSAQRQNFGLTS